MESAADRQLLRRALCVRANVFLSKQEAGRLSECTRCAARCLAYVAMDGGRASIQKIAERSLQRIDGLGDRPRNVVDRGRLFARGS